MARYTTSLVERVEVAEGTMEFSFARPVGFGFVAGQHMTVILPKPLHIDDKGNRRTFTIASPPEDTARLQIATRMTGSALKRSLAEMPLEGQVDLQGPSGDFTLHADGSVPAVFIAGGIGITPFRSMAHDAFLRRLPHAVTLVYSSRTPESAAFHEEFRGMAAQRPTFRYIPTMTQAGDSKQHWDGETRSVTADFLREKIGDLTLPFFYIAGPPAMVEALKKAVTGAGAPADRVRTEEFDGY